MSEFLTAIINEADCVGCGRCLPACPVDAIIGAPKHSHTVLTNECIGCKLCVAPCPMDCIHIEPLGKIIDKAARAKLAKYRHQQKLKRLKKKTPLTLPVYESKEERQQSIKEQILAAHQRTQSKRVKRHE